MSNGAVHLAGSEAIPYDSVFDVVISNGVLNFLPMKERCFREIYRILKPNGRLRFADIVLKLDLPAGIINSLETWSD
ncbi:MAG: methyltransferase domain-containing protein [Candidatus Brocadia sp.]|nr:methyltransferase domain-containing protein [Candidatus Brocadia sp.]